MADIVLPATSTLERDDIGFATREPLMVAMKAVAPPPGQARDDYAIFAEVARRLGAEQAFTEGLDTAGWLRRLYEESALRAKGADIALPAFDDFWRAGEWRLPAPAGPVVMLDAFRADPQAHPLRTPSGRIEIHSACIAGFDLDDCPGHPVWRAPREWLGAPLAQRYPLHLISDQPHTKLHSQLDFAACSRANKVAGREPVLLHPQDAQERHIRDGEVVRIHNARGACLAGARLDAGVQRGVVRLSTGAWWDPEDPASDGSLDRHGNPNVLTQDRGASRLSQGCSAQSCLVEVERWDGDAPPVRAFEPPSFAQR